MIKILSLILCLSILSGCAAIQQGMYNTGLMVERSWAGFEQKQIEVDDHTWVYLEKGEPGQPTIVLLHGFAADKDNWTRMTRYLEGYRIIAPDLPGHGESTFNADLFYGMDLQSRRLASFVDAIGLTRFHLVGNSMGGAISSMYAYRHPQKVETLSLLCTVGLVGDRPSDLITLLLQNKPNPLIVREDDKFQELLNFVAHEQPVLPWPAKNVLGRMAVERVEANDKIFSHIYPEIQVGNLSGGFAAVFSRIQAPTYVIWGEEDRVLHVSSVDKLFQHIPNVRTEILPGIGHVPMIEVPEAIAMKLARFWQESESAHDFAVSP